VYRLLGYKTAFAKTPYASQLFGDDPHETYEHAVAVRKMGFRAAKFGWGPYGRGDAETDRHHVEAARGGLGEDVTLLVDVGTVWGEDVDRARARIPALEANGVGWIEEPFACGALDAHQKLAAETSIPLAGGEGCHNIHQAKTMIVHAALGYIQIDAGRIGGITIAKQAADYASARGVRYVNHTFTTHLALSASLQPYAGLEGDCFCEYPFSPSILARELTKESLALDPQGRIQLPEKPGLGMDIDLEVVAKYVVDTEIRVGGRLLYRTPQINGGGEHGHLGAPHAASLTAPRFEDG
jgi:L-alanine-DL-glutamate epimerase-like enolase superfamily enzyme